MRPTAKITLDGNFFRRDPGKTIRKNAGDMLDELAEWAEGQVRTQIEGRSGSMPGSTGWTARNVKGSRTSERTGKTWELSVAVNASTNGMSKADAIRTKAAVYGRRNGDHGTARGIEERFHPFRRTKSAISRARAVISANLTKGLE